MIYNTRAMLACKKSKPHNLRSDFRNCFLEVLFLIDFLKIVQISKKLSMYELLISHRITKTFSPKICKIKTKSEKQNTYLSLQNNWSSENRACSLQRNWVGNGTFQSQFFYSNFKLNFDD